VKRLILTLLLASLLLVLAPIGPVRADTGQAPEAVPAACDWRKALVSYDREIRVEGTTAAVQFEVADGCTVELSLVSYEAPTAVFDPSLAAQQKLFAAETDVYGPGQHRVEVPLPECFWQVDFVAGKPIQDLSPTNLYGKRLIVGRSGGEECAEAPTTTTPARLGVTTTTTTAGKLPFTGAASTPMLLAGLGLVGGGLLILWVSRGRGRATVR
jgi:hypothetical protein